MKINFICSPGIGHLDNLLPLIQHYEQKEITNIIFTKLSMVKGLDQNPILKKLLNKYIKKKYVLINDKLILINSLKKFNSLIESKFINFIILKILITLNFALLERLIFKFYEIKSIKLNDFFNNQDVVVYDPFEIDKKYFQNIFVSFLNCFQIGIRHGIGNDNFLKNEKKYKIKNLIYLSHSVTQSKYIKQKLGLKDHHILKSGVIKYSPNWVNKIRKEKNDFQNKNKFKNSIFLISRHNTNYFIKSDKILILKIIKKKVIDELNQKIIVKLHPKEDPNSSKKIYYDIFGREEYNKTWCFSKSHSFQISQLCNFAISFISSVSIDLLNFKKPTIEMLNFGKKSNKQNFSFLKNNLVIPSNDTRNFNNILLKMIHGKFNCKLLLNNFSKNYYKVDNIKTFKTIYKYHYEYSNNLCKKKF